MTAGFDADDVDTDDGPATLTYAILVGPVEGSVVNNNDGTFTFDPDSDFEDLNSGETRDATFTYKATDSHAADSNTADDETLERSMLEPLQNHAARVLTPAPAPLAATCPVRKAMFRFPSFDRPQL